MGGSFYINSRIQASIKMHILVITPGFPGDEKETDCIPPMQNYFRLLKKKYPEIVITVITIHYPYVQSVYNWNTIKVFSCGACRVAQPKRFLYWMRAISYEIKINNEQNVDIIHSFWLTETALIAVLVNMIIHTKHICTIMGQDARKKNKYLKFLPLNKITKIAVSDFQAKVFSDSTGKKVDNIINWGIDEIGSYNADRIFDIIGVGALVPVKKYKMFVEIISVIVEEFPCIKCLLIGEGTEQSEIESLIEHYGMKEKIILTGHIRREEVLDKMKRSRILLHTSCYESFGYVIPEALASGCFVVCRQTGCAKENKKTFIAEKPEEFIECIRKLLKSEFEYSSFTPFKISETLDSYFSLYNNL
jgi:1,2-diacylglycerol 3-alpha-glucosyltransferase